MVLCIVWKRAGLKLNPSIWRRTDGSPYESGTVLEFETAVEVSRKHKRRAGRLPVPQVRAGRLRAPTGSPSSSSSTSCCRRCGSAGPKAPKATTLPAIRALPTRMTSRSSSKPACGNGWSGAASWRTARSGIARVKGSPFRGLAAFEAAHSAVFFGREHAIARATTKLRAAPFLLLIGASGSGKSSLLRAGLLPRLTAPRRACRRRPLADSAAQRGRRSDPRARAMRCSRTTRSAPSCKAGDFSTPDLLAELLATGGKAALAPIRAALARAAQICGRRRCAMTRQGPQSS